MKKLQLFSIILCLVILFGCTKAAEEKSSNEVTGMAAADTSQAEPETQDDEGGIRVSDWYKSEKYNQDVIDILNFYDIEKTLKITTVCFDEAGGELPTDDTEIIDIPAQHQQTWIPVCPTGTNSFTIDVKELN